MRREAARERLTLAAARRELKAGADRERAAGVARYLQAGPGGYGAPDRFLGLRVPVVRRLARRYRDLPLADVSRALESPWHEERLLALLVLVDRYARGSDAERTKIFRLYWRRRQRVNNWDLVDLSAPRIVGPHLAGRLVEGVESLLRSPRVWDRRIAVLATLHATARGDMDPALAVCARVLDDPHDLVHKASGWMLREVGRRDRRALERFLRQHAGTMPATMLRYAIEHLPPADRQRFRAARRRR